MIFALGVRVIFVQSLNGKFRDTLNSLARSAASDMEFENGRLKVKGDFSLQELNQKNQALQWFDLQGNLVVTKGRDVINFPFFTNKIGQIETDARGVKAMIWPVISIESDRMIGYVRASQAPKDFDKIIRALDLGLSGGIVMALVLSGVGGILLTRQAMQPVEQGFQRLKQFTADASHELRGPLMAIKSNVAVALKYPEEMRTTDAEKFQAIASAASQMTQLTEDLLLLARSEKLERENRKPVNLEMLLGSLVQLNASRAHEKQINLKIGSTGDLYLLGEPTHLSRLFSNLIENALHYTPEGGTVEIQSSSKGEYLYVNVQDTGIGIAPEHLRHIFERFWRADQSRSYWAGGSGLGLAIAQAIAQNHGGLITVTSQVGVGSCFTVRLPDCTRS
jgi:signal transduction histidine kinase